MPGLYEEEIHIPQDLEALDAHALIHAQLVSERAAGLPRILEDLHVGAELGDQINNAKTSDRESFKLHLDKDQQRILRISRQLAPLAIFSD